MTDLVATDPSVTRMVVIELEAADPALAPAIAPAVLALEASRTTAVERVTLAASADLRPLLAGATAVLSLGWAGLGLDLDPAAAAQIVPSAKRVLAAAAADPPDLLVMISSATVYGAWPTNPVPLTEDAAIKPNPGFEPAAALAEVERLAVEWAEEHPATATAVLRPVTSVAPDRPGWLARALRSALGFPVEDHDPPTQFLQLDDLAAAVDAVRRTRPRGALNVAPDGWLNGPDRRALDVRPRLRLPAAMAARVHAWRWRLGLAPTPPTLLPYAVHPWVVAN
ncbi:MAG: NAD-dependent epimerase/dehydratase family protein, partial [Acidimicrobiales bacterium]